MENRNQRAGRGTRFRLSTPAINIPSVSMGTTGMNLAHLSDIIGRSRLRGWRWYALFVTFAGSIGFNQLFEAANPPYTAWRPFVPAELTWFQSLPFWCDLVALTAGVLAAGIAYYTSYRRRLPKTVYRLVKRAIRCVGREPTLARWLFAEPT